MKFINLHKLNSNMFFFKCFCGHVQTVKYWNIYLKTFQYFTICTCPQKHLKKNVLLLFNLWRSINFIYLCNIQFCMVVIILILLFTPSYGFNRMLYIYPVTGVTYNFNLYIFSYVIQGWLASAYWWTLLHPQHEGCLQGLLPTRGPVQPEEVNS
jgi:hypothetical protein